MRNLIVEVALPIYNEENELWENTLKLYAFLKKTYGGGNFKITIADNGSTDRSILIAKKLSRQYKEIGYIHLEEKGRGRVIKKVWSESKADVLAYMDIDLSTDLVSFPKIVKAVKENGYDIAIGSRLLPGSKIFKRPLSREILSRVYNIMIKLFFFTNFSDAQCGFKAISNKIKWVLKKIVDNEWFFDTELLIYAEKSGLKIYEEPVIWIDNPGSTVRVLRTIKGDLLGLLRLFIKRPWRQK